MQHIPKPHYDSDAEHSEYSPSGSKRWVNCPASIMLLRRLPKKEEEGTNFYAEEGTCAHELAAYCLDEELDAETQVNKLFNNMTVTKEMARETQKYIDYVRGQVTWDSTLWVENRLSLQHIQATMFGTADAIIVSEDSLEVVDLKYGRGVVVEAEGNYQMMTYAIGALAHLAKHGIKFDPSFDVKMTIVQPRAPHADGPIRSSYVTVAQLKDFQKKLIAAVNESISDKPSFGPTEDGCRWCEAGPMCKAYAEYNLKQAQLEFAEFEKPTREFKQDLIAPDLMSEDQILGILKHGKAIEHWIKSVVEYALQQLEQGKPVKGYKLVYGRSIRAWDNQEEAFKILEEYGADMERFYNKKPLSPAQAEKECTEEEWDIVKDYIFKPQGKMTIAPETDSRPAVSVNGEAASDWADEV